MMQWQSAEQMGWIGGSVRSFSSADPPPTVPGHPPPLTRSRSATLRFLGAACVEGRGAADGGEFFGQTQHGETPLLDLGEEVKKREQKLYVLVERACRGMPWIPVGSCAARGGALERLISTFL